MDGNVSGASGSSQNRVQVLNQTVEAIQRTIAEARETQQRLNQTLTEDKENIAPQDLPSFSATIAETNRTIQELQPFIEDAQVRIAAAQRSQTTPVAGPSHWNGTAPSPLGDDSNNNASWNDHNAGPSWNDPR